MATRGTLVLVFGLACGACVFTVELGEEPPPPAARIPGCVPVDPQNVLDVGAQVVGRPVFRTVTVRNCVAEERTLTLDLDGDVGSWRVVVESGTTEIAPVSVAAGDSVDFTLQFLVDAVRPSVATLHARFPGESTALALQGSGRDGPEVTTEVDCSGEVRMVASSMVLGPETDPLRPATALALHGVQTGECFEVQGDVVILGTPLAHLDVLAGLRRVGGRLLIGHELGGNLALQQVDGLANLVEVAGDVVVQDNPALRTIDGMLHLRAIGGALTVANNRSLVDVEGLSGLETLAGGVDITRNRRLRNLRGLRLLVDIPGDLSINGNLTLANLSGLASLARVGGSLGIAFNDALKSLQGLENVVEVGPYLGVQGNAILGNLDGLQGITTAEEVVIAQNAQLRSLEGLGGLRTASLVVVSDHPALESLGGLGALTTVERNFLIQGNQVLASLGLDALEDVGSLLLIHDNPRLSTEEAQALADRIGADADIRNNGMP